MYYIYMCILSGRADIKATSQAAKVREALVAAEFLLFK